MNLEKAIGIALDFEVKVRNHYESGAKTIADAQGRRVFEVLAREEDGHVKYLEHCLDEWKQTGRVTEKGVATVLPTGIDWVAAAHKRFEDGPSPRIATSSELDLVKTALSLEVETSGFYRSLVGKLPAQEQRMFDRFMEIEDGHVALVQAQLDLLTGIGVWFDQMEFSLEGEMG